MNDFGKIIRKARIDTGETLSTMAKALGKTVSFLSAIETGVKKIPMEIVPQIREYLVSKGANTTDLLYLEDHANIVNGSIKLDGLKPSQKQMMATFARSDLSQEQLDLINKILNAK
ncbi:helix-turn-helix domain-containing protein [Haemophilus influenzae]|uniref:helix-turn-helix domain-containing protein n=1 Tax=Haemophilus influenzae TaxID=727 RepID=UPI0013A6C3C4|nr:helix-turn-helix transcriptional regulator [Haemophilus influenzae]MCK8951246.1 helix-turn-helix domain-containing protein [Haemophilus influenzae]